MNPSEDHYILETHRVRVERVNRQRWQNEPAEAGPAPAGSRSSIAKLARHHLGAMLIRTGERLLPSPAVPDCEPC